MSEMKERLTRNLASSEPKILTQFETSSHKFGVKYIETSHVTSGVDCDVY